MVAPAKLMAQSQISFSHYSNKLLSDQGLQLVQRDIEDSTKTQLCRTAVEIDSPTHSDRRFPVTGNLSVG